MKGNELNEIKFAYWRNKNKVVSKRHQTTQTEEWNNVKEGKFLINSFRVHSLKKFIPFYDLFRDFCQSVYKYFGKEL